MAMQSETVSVTRAPGAGSATGRLVNGERLWRALIWTLLLVGACVMMLPFLWLVTSSLKTELEVFQYPPKWIPSVPGRILRSPHVTSDLYEVVKRPPRLDKSRW